jgi:hypothetical protein
VKKRLQLLPVPHVTEIQGDTKENCEFCDKKAVIKLYIFNHDKSKELKLTLK